MLKDFPLEHLKKLVTLFLQMNDAIVESGGHTIGIFKSRLPGLNEADKRTKSRW